MERTEEEKKRINENVRAWKKENVKRVSFELRIRDDKPLLDFIAFQKERYGVATNAVIRSALEEKAKETATAREIQQGDNNTGNGYSFVVKAVCNVNGGAIPSWLNSGKKIPCEKMNALLDDGATLKLEREYSYIVNRNCYALTTRYGLFALVVDEKAPLQQQQEKQENNKDYLMK